MNDTIKERDITFDVAKGISILLMTIGHLELFKNYPTIISTNKEYFYFFKLPLFIFISGALFSQRSTFLTFVNHKADSLIKPVLTIFILVFTVYFIKISYFDSVPLKDAFVTSRRFILYESMFPLWFPIILFIAMICFKGILTIKDNYSKKYFLITIALLLTTLTLITHLNIEIYIFKFHSVIYFLLILYLGYFAKKENWFNHIYNIYVLIFSLFLFSIIILFRNTLLIEIDLFENKIGSFIPTFLVMVSGIIVVLNISKLISKSKIISKTLIYCSYSSLFILAFHVLISNYFLYPFLQKYFGNNILIDITTFILTILSCYLLYKATFKVKFLNKFLLPLKTINSK